MNGQGRWWMKLTMLNKVSIIEREELVSLHEEQFWSSGAAGSYEEVWVPAGLCCAVSDVFGWLVQIEVVSLLLTCVIVALLPMIPGMMWN